MKTLIIVITSLLLGTAALAQEADKALDSQKFYKLDIVVKELEAGKLTSARNYALSVAADKSSGRIRTNDKAPIPTGKEGQISYVDIGVSIDCRVNSVNARGDLIMYFSSVVSSLVNQVIAETRWEGSFVLPVRKPTTVFSSDAASNKRQMQLEITATPVP